MTRVPAHYKFDSYVTLERWNSYWYQITEVLRLKPKTVLIIGCGDNCAGKILAGYGLKIYTYDLDRKLKPDFAGNILHIDKKLGGRHFDVILCCQVLEHLPYENFMDILPKLRNISKYIIISLPYSNFLGCAVSCKLPLLKTLRIGFGIPPGFLRKLRFNGEHYWEVGARGYSRVKIVKDLSKFFVIRRQYRALYNSYHLFFVCQRR
ncbi:MAG: methyltransferase type 11 [Candidatus Margulisbacteria bacterium]|jgi:hypothetical protein|nr:methyltransferase type 11 [Candidatus Margulisiibacteriota bacterium]